MLHIMIVRRLLLLLQDHHEISKVDEVTSTPHTEAPESYEERKEHHERVDLKDL